MNFYKQIRLISYKAYPLLSSASFLILWMMAFSSSAIAQINSSSTNQFESGVKPSKDKIQHLQSSSERMASRISLREKLLAAKSEFKNHGAFESNLTALTAKDILELSLESPKKIKLSQSCSIATCQQTAQISQAAPTFEQRLNLDLPQQQPNDSETLREENLVPLSIQRSLSQQEQQNPISIREPSAILQGVYVTQGGDTSARARVSGIYPVTPQTLLGSTIDLTSEDNSFDDSRGGGLNINELYLATSLKKLPNLRFVIGQMDLTSYFDRNSFAKDGASHFFNPVFQTNPALSSTGIGSRAGLLVNWSPTDRITAKAAVFSSSQGLNDFSLNGFAGEVGIRYGNAIVRGTYSTAKDAGNRDSFAESFGIARGNNQFGLLENDREEAYGINAELFIPKSKLGLFGRYGRYENRDLGEGADTYSFGLSFLDLFAPDDRLGLAYGRALSNDALRRGKQPDVVELFYDVKLLPNLRVGLSFQGRDSFDESVVGIRVKSEFDITPRRNSR